MDVFCDSLRVLGGLEEGDQVSQPFGSPSFQERLGVPFGCRSFSSSLSCQRDSATDQSSNQRCERRPYAVCHAIRLDDEGKTTVPLPCQGTIMAT
jgi:hypothetical protein